MKRVQVWEVQVDAGMMEMAGRVPEAGCRPICQNNSWGEISFDICGVSATSGDWHNGLVDVAGMAFGGRSFF